MTVLILAGTGEGRLIAEHCAANGIKAIASLAGATRQPKMPNIETRIGGFGGADGFRDFITSQGISAIIDATHPFAENITRRSYDIATTMDVPFLRFERPAWDAGPGDNWTEIDRAEDAAPLIADGENVFLATGRQTLPGFANLTHCKMYCRQIDPPDAPFPFENGEYLIGRPPFSVASEINLFEALKINTLVVKNAGGAASATKLTAARELRIHVLMIKRPAATGAETYRDLEQVFQWPHLK